MSEKYEKVNKCGTVEMKALALTEYIDCKRAYKNTILKANRNAWRSILNDLDKDQWGQGYKFVEKRNNLKQRTRLSDSHR